MCRSGGVARARSILPPSPARTQIRGWLGRRLHHTHHCRDAGRNRTSQDAVAVGTQGKERTR
eukprot:13620695-Alexandrium_andersonii.AAC.1